MTVAIPTPTSTHNLKIGFVVLVGASAGLMALQTGASMLEVSAVAVIGFGLGSVLLWYLSRMVSNAS